MGTIEELRNLLRKGYKWYFENTEGYHKSQEMRITLSKHYPDYWESAFQGVKYTIEVYSYVFVREGRRFEYEGKSEEECIDKAIEYFTEMIKEWKEDKNE